MEWKAHQSLVISAGVWAAALAFAPPGAARAVSDRAAEAVRLEARAAQLRRRAERAEAEAAWHGKRAKEWEEFAGRLDARGDFALESRSSADFNADTHRRQRARKLRRATQLRQEIGCLQQRAGELRSSAKPKGS